MRYTICTSFISRLPASRASLLSVASTSRQFLRIHRTALASRHTYTFSTGPIRVEGAYKRQNFYQRSGISTPKTQQNSFQNVFTAIIIVFLSTIVFVFVFAMFVTVLHNIDDMLWSGQFFDTSPSGVLTRSSEKNCLYGCLPSVISSHRHYGSLLPFIFVLLSFHFCPIFIPPLCIILSSQGGFHLLLMLLCVFVASNDYLIIIV